MRSYVHLVRTNLYVFIYSNCPVDIIFHLIGEVRKNVLTPASLDACTLAAAPLVSGERDNAASAKPATAVASKLASLLHACIVTMCVVITHHLLPSVVIDLCSCFVHNQYLSSNQSITLGCMIKHSMWFLVTPQFMPK